MRFFFAWADQSETTFSPEHEREDEKVFSFSLQHAEGEFATCDIDIVNPEVGLLAPGRKQWAWLSVLLDDATDVVPIFFGRLVAVPQDLENEVIELSFVARPHDYSEQVRSLADSMRVAPFYDPIWLSDDDLVDPDAVLEGYSKLWHIDRVTLEVTASDIIQGEDGLLTFHESDAFSDGTSIAFSTAPVTKVVVQATVNWAQTASGAADITKYLVQEFQDGTPSGWTTVDGSSRPQAGDMIGIVAGDALIQSWPKPGTTIGGGWLVGPNTYATLVGQPPLPPILVGDMGKYTAVQLWQTFPGNSVALGLLFTRSPGFVIDIQGNDITFQSAAFGGGILRSEIDILWVPIWRIAVAFEAAWAVNRDRTEVLSFSINADVQPLISDANGTDASGDSIVYLTLGPADVDAVISDPASPRYFGTGRGAQSLENLIARARATLLSRARAVDVTWACSFEAGLAFSCRKSAVLFDHRMPGGVAEGKIKSYTLGADGDSGALTATVTVGCTVGRNGTIEEVRGTPSYVADGYVNDGWEELDGAIIVPIAGEIGYGLPDYSTNDDGANLRYVNAREWIEDLVVVGTLQQQQDSVDDGSLAPTATAAQDKINNTLTRVSLTMTPFGTGPYSVNVEPTMTDLKIPRTINLEAGSNTEGTV